MGLVERILSLLGVGKSKSERGQSDTTVSVEREADTSVEREEPVAEKADAAASTASMVDEGASGAEAAEQAEAVGPESEDVEAERESEDVEAERESEDVEAERESDDVEEPVAEETDAAASTASMVDEGASGAEAAEQAEAVGPESEDMEVERESDEEGETPSGGATETTDDAGTEPVESVTGIGPAYAARLGDAGIETVADLAAADVAALAEKTDISEKRLATWIDRANEGA